MNDTDERIAARTLYEIIVNSYNVAVYTRDDDIRKLISTTFRLLVSRQICDEEGYIFLKNLSHLNLLVLKYNYEKKSFSRFFESSTLSNPGEFRFPRKLSSHKISQIIPSVDDFLRKIKEEFDRLQDSENVAAEEPEEMAEEMVMITLQKAFSLLCDLKIEQDDMENVHRKIGVLERLSVLARVLKCPEVEMNIEKATREHQRERLENLLASLKEEKDQLKEVFETLSAQEQKGLEYWKQVQSAAEGIQENLLQIRFFDNAIRHDFYHVSFDEYEKFKKLLYKFHEYDFSIDTKGTPVPTEKISEFTGKPTAEIIKTIELHSIRYESACAYLTQDNLILFLDLLP